MTTAAHYRLTSDEFLHINSTLTNAQLRVYMYYKTLDPFGDRRVEICTKAIAKTLGVTQRTVQLALNKLSSMGMIMWEKSKSFITRSCDRLGEMRIAKAKLRSPWRNEDRERQLELNLQAASETSQSSSSLFKLDQLDQEEIFDFEDTENLEITLEETFSVEDAIAEIRKSLPDELTQEQNDELTQEQNDELPEESNRTGEGKPTRAAVEQFVLKTLNKTFPSADRRAAYFSKFDAKSWKKWEADYKASLVVQAPYKPYLPEKVEVAASDSPIALSAIAQIKAKLGIKK